MPLFVKIKCHVAGACVLAPCTPVALLRIAGTSLQSGRYLKESRLPEFTKILWKKKKRRKDEITKSMESMAAQPQRAPAREGKGMWTRCLFLLVAAVLLRPGTKSGRPSAPHPAPAP